MNILAPAHEDEIIVFKKGDLIAYPFHGVGHVSDIQTETVNNTTIDLMIVVFNDSKIVIKVPMKSAYFSGARHLSNIETLQNAMQFLENDSDEHKKKINWTKRSSGYEEQLGAGDVMSLVYLIKELCKRKSYSERKIFNIALSCFTTEYAVVHGIEIKKVHEIIMNALAKSQTEYTPEEGGDLEYINIAGNKIYDQEILEESHDELANTLVE